MIAVNVNHNEIIAECGSRIGTTVANLVSQLNAEPKTLEGRPPEISAGPFLYDVRSVLQC